jgi:hypothetical protein
MRPSNGVSLELHPQFVPEFRVRRICMRTHNLAMSWKHTRYSGVEQNPNDNDGSPTGSGDKHAISHRDNYLAAHPRTRQSRSIWTLLQEWRWEFSTWLLGTFALTAIVALVVLYRDRSLKEWTSDISLATVVAALSQVAQSSLLVSVSSCIGQLKWEWLRQKRPASDLDKFDEASRGPQGSLLLLLRSRQ